MDLRTEIGMRAFMTAWCVLPSFFWLRGCWRNDTSDRVIGGALLVFFAIASCTFNPATDLITSAAAWVIPLGILTPIMGRLGQRMVFRQAFWLRVLLILGGVMMLLMV